MPTKSAWVCSGHLSATAVYCGPNICRCSIRPSVRILTIAKPTRMSRLSLLPSGQLNRSLTAAALALNPQPRTTPQAQQQTNRSLHQASRSFTPTLHHAPSTAGCSRATRTFAVQSNVATPSSLTSDGSTPTWDIRVLFDGECPLCVKEVDFLKSRDAGSGKIDFVDIASPEYSPDMNAGLSFEQAMGEIHAILPDGSVVTKVEVFRRLYEMVGLGWVYAITKLPGVGPAADAVYDLWAKYRLPITGRPDLLEVVKRRSENANCKDERLAQVAATSKGSSSSDK